MKKILTLLFSLIFCVALFSSCNAPALELEKQLVIAYSTPSLQNSFWISVSNAMQEEAAQNNVNLIIRDAGSDISKQAADIEDFIQEKVDAILLTPYDSVSLSPSIRNINKAGIPVVAYDQYISRGELAAYRTSDNYQAGYLGGEYIAARFRNKPELRLILVEYPHVSSTVERVNGFDENYVGWGYEDDDFARRLYQAGLAPRSVIAEARALHLWHPSLAPQALARHRDRPNRAYFRRWRVPAFCANGLRKGDV